MARIPYPDLEAHEAVRQAADAARRARDGAVINLYRMLLHSPPLATAWLELGSCLRYRGQLDDRTRELVICLVARRTQSVYEWHHHAPLARAAGISSEQLAALDKCRDRANSFSCAERDILAYADAVLAGQVDEAVLASTQDRLGDVGLVELTGLVAYYLSVSRFIAALGVEPEAISEPEKG